MTIVKKCSTSHFTTVLPTESFQYPIFPSVSAFHQLENLTEGLTNITPAAIIESGLVCHDYSTPIDVDYRRLMSVPNFNREMEVMRMTLSVEHTFNNCTYELQLSLLAFDPVYDGNGQYDPSTKLHPETVSIKGGLGDDSDAIRTYVICPAFGASRNSLALPVIPNAIPTMVNKYREGYKGLAIPLRVVDEGMSGTIIPIKWLSRAKMLASLLTKIQEVPLGEPSDLDNIIHSLGDVHPLGHDRVVIGDALDALGDRNRPVRGYYHLSTLWNSLNHIMQLPHREYDEDSKKQVPTALIPLISEIIASHSEHLNASDVLKIHRSATGDVCYVTCGSGLINMGEVRGAVGELQAFHTGIPDNETVFHVPAGCDFTNILIIGSATTGHTVAIDGEEVVTPLFTQAQMFNSDGALYEIIDLLYAFSVKRIEQKRNC